MDAVDTGVSIANLSPERWRRLQRAAQRLSRRADEAEDLLQDVLLAAFEAGRSDEAWLHGALRRRAAFLARGAGRRQRHEALIADGWSPGLADVLPDAGFDAATAALRCAAIDALPAATRQVLLLALHGLASGEIQWLLGVSPAAFRQRLAALRKAIARLPAPAREALEAGWTQRNVRHPCDPAFGLRRRGLLAAAIAMNAAGSHDPDGHLLMVGRHAHVPALSGNKGKTAAEGDVFNP